MRAFRAVVGALVPLSVFGFVLYRVGWAELDESRRLVWYCAVALFVALSLLMRRDGGLRRLCVATLALVSVALPVAARWHTASSDETMLGGLLPFSDAHGYYHCAAALGEGFSFRETAADSFCSRRPMFPATLGAIMGATGRLRLSLAIFLAASALTMLAAAQAVAGTHGSVPGALLLILMVLFYRPVSAAILTEHLGVALGCLGFTLLWRSCPSRSDGLALYGMAAMSLALNARAGAMCVLVGIGAWYVVSLTTLKKWRATVWALLAIASGFLITSILTNGLGLRGAPFGNFSYTFYGIVYGGDWTLALRQHPEWAGLAEAARSQAIIGDALDGLVEQPSRAVAAMLRALPAFAHPDHLFAYVPFPMARFALALLAALGVALCAWRFKDRRHALLLATTLGTLLSVPFVPPWDGGIRILAATIPFTVALCALGASAFSTRRHDGPQTSWPTDRALMAAVGTAALVPLSALVAVAAFPGPVRLPATTSECQESVMFRWPVDAVIAVRPNPGEDPKSRPVGEVPQRAFRAGLRPLARDHPGLAEELRSARAPFFLLAAEGFERNPVILLVNAAVVGDRQPRDTLHRACVAASAEPEARRFGLRHVLSLTTIGETR